jgi:hypothetical protein
MVIITALRSRPSEIDAGATLIRTSMIMIKAVSIRPSAMNAGANLVRTFVKLTLISFSTLQVVW